LKPQPRIALLAGLALAALFGCRGQTTDENPIWIKHGMEFQPKWLPYGKNTFAADGLKADDDYFRGGKDTAHYAANPMKIDAVLLERGQERFQIYCAPCHGPSGMGDGMVIKHGFPIPPPSFHDDRVVAMPDGQLFHTITYGVRNMPSYGKQVPEEDRWAIVAYLRALQRSSHATLNDVPESERANLK
jgi:mono/diheme cytochrome c family protein